MKKIVIIFSILVGLVASTQAQFTTKDLFTPQEKSKIKVKSDTKKLFSQFNAGMGIPLDQFAAGDLKFDDISDGKGFAALGFTAGYKLYYLIGGDNLSFVFNIQGFYNELNKNLKDDINDEVDGYYADITFPKYINFPATIGLNYAIPLGESVKIYGEGMVGANYSILTKFSGTYNEVRYETDFTPAFGVAFGFECGLFNNERITVGVKYNNLGSYKYKYKGTYNEGWGFDREKGIYNRALPISNISVCVGIMF